MRRILVGLAVLVAATLTACGSVAGPLDLGTLDGQSEQPTPSVVPSDDETGESTSPVPDPDQDPSQATAIDESMTVSLPDDWRYAPELETPYTVFTWSKEDGTQNLSMAPLGPWSQIESPEEYVEELTANGTLADATATIEGDIRIDGYDGFWMSVEGPGYVANIYYINVKGGIKEVTANAYHSFGLAEIDRLVHTIDFY